MEESQGRDKKYLAFLEDRTNRNNQDLREDPRVLQADCLSLARHLHPSDSFLLLLLSVLLLPKVSLQKNGICNNERERNIAIIRWAATDQLILSYFTVKYPIIPWAITRTNAAKEALYTDGILFLRLKAMNH